MNRSNENAVRQHGVGTEKQSTYKFHYLSIDLDLQPDKWAIASYYAIAKQDRLTCGSQRVRQQFGVRS